MNATTCRCGRCDRPLSAAESVADGYGPICRARLLTAARSITSQYSPAQVTKAIEAVELGAVVRVDRDTHLVLSSDGTVAYEVDLPARSCTCRARVWCYHLAAIQITIAVRDLAAAGTR